MRFVLLKIMLAPENCQSLKINDVIWLKCSEQTMFRIASHSNVILNMHKKYLLIGNLCHACRAIQKNVLNFF